jgi:GWxTD domain-containing protein
MAVPLIGMLMGCSSSPELSESEALRSFGAEKLDVQPEFRVFHVSADSTILYLKFSTNNLLYTKSEDVFAAKVEITIDPSREGGEAKELPKKKKISVPPINRSVRGKDVMVKTSIFLPQGSDYSIRIDLRDRANGKSISKLVKASKTDRKNRQNFIAREEGAKAPLFYDRIAPQTTYLIRSRGDHETLYVNYYDRSFSLPGPPFAHFDPGPMDFAPDDQFTVEVEDGLASFTSGEKGFYHFRKDTTVKTGFTLFVSSDEFPEVKKVSNLLDPFRYLVSGKEYKNILESDDVKAAIEKHWISWAGDQNRARNSIKAYYSRVELANRFFSSHLEGWKSDRGLIFLVYGKPDKIYRTEKSETWIYGEENNPLSITFKFDKVYNPFTDNDYRLNREDYYKPSWYRSIEAWRNGRIY